MLPFTGGTPTLTSELIQRVETSRHRNGIEGITLLGGEPFAHAAAGAVLARAAWDRGLSVMVFTGHTLEELRGRPDTETADLLAHTDILVDGPYIRELPDATRRWIGSTNQQIHFLTDRYRADDPCWRKRNTIEIRLIGNHLSVNGFPAAEAVGLWKRPPRAALNPGKPADSRSTETNG
jgi:anaerobic ribonucleoside-triphosphate reductase activating protein